MSNKIVARLEGDCSYSDGTRNSFAVSLDDDGTIVPDGAAAVMGDIINYLIAMEVERVKAAIQDTEEVIGRWMQQ